MEKEKRRKQKLDDGRIDAERVINELMEGVDLQVGPDAEDPESKNRLLILFHYERPMPLSPLIDSGLQLFVGKDGSVTFDKSTAPRDYEPVVFAGPR